MKEIMIGLDIACILSKITLDMITDRKLFTRRRNKKSLNKRILRSLLATSLHKGGYRMVISIINELEGSCSFSNLFASLRYQFVAMSMLVTRK